MVVEPREVLDKRHMFAELYWLLHDAEYKQKIRSAHYDLPTDIDPEERYMQYLDMETNRIEVVPYEEFIRLILT